MPICRNCGVEIEEAYSHCPLCGASTTGREELGGADASKEETAVIERHERRVRLLFRDVFGFIALAGAVVVFAVDFAYGMQISWSRFPLSAIGYIWIAVLLVSRLKDRPYLLILAETAALGLFLYLLDRFTSGTPWYFELALPLTLILAALIAVVTAVTRRMRLSALGGLSAALVAAGVYSICTELVLHGFLEDGLRVSWSLITAAAVIPIIAFLVYFEKRLEKQGSDLNKYFHV